MRTVLRTFGLDLVLAVQLDGDEAVLGLELPDRGQAARGLGQCGQSASVDALERVAHACAVLSRRPAPSMAPVVVVVVVVGRHHGKVVPATW